MAQTVNKHTILANKLASKYDADVILYNGGIDWPADREIWNLCNNIKTRQNAILYLCTFGGNADVAYRIARCLQRKYTKFTVNIHGFCKSAGTLIAIGASEIAMSESGELGPLDAQIAKEDDIVGNSSGLNIEEALDKLQEKSFESLERCFLPIIQKSGGRISTKTAIQIASNLVIGLYGKIYEHIDPIQIGEVNRAMKIALYYGKKLNERSGILKENSLDHLVTQYCDHGFVIDQEEAEKLFKNIRIASKEEIELAEEIGSISVWPEGDDQGKPLICLLSDTGESTKKEGGNNANGEKSDSSTRNNKVEKSAETDTKKE